jgi:hypothetical protein
MDVLILLTYVYTMTPLEVTVNSEPAQLTLWL